MELYTIDGKRPDLSGAAIEYQKPDEYIGSKILPVSPASQTTGVLYYATKTEKKDAQTGRTTATAPNQTLIANSHLTFTCSEVIQRGAIAQEEVKHMGGIENADKIGAQFAVNSVADTIEGNIADLSLKVDKAADYSFVASTILHDVATAKTALKGYYGKTTLFASEEVIQKLWLAMNADNSLYDSLRRLIATRVDLDVNAWAAAIRVLFGIDRVLIGTNEIWNEGERGDRFGLGRLYDGPDGIIYHAKPIYGVQKVYIPDPANPDWPYEVSSFPDKKALVNLYTAQSWTDNVVFNEGAVKVFDLGEHSDSASASGSASA